MSFKVEKVDKLPVRKFPTRSKIYDDVIKAVRKKEAGSYKVSIEGKKVNTLYQALSKRLRGSKDIQLHMRSNEVYLEKL